MHTVVIELIVIFALIVVHGFFACSEFAIISVRKSRIAQLLGQGDERAALVAAMQSDPHRLLSVVQVGMTVIGSSASAVGGVIAVGYLRPILQASKYAVLSRAAKGERLALGRHLLTCEEVTPTSITKVKIVKERRGHPAEEPRSPESEPTVSRNAVN